MPNRPRIGTRAAGTRALLTLLLVAVSALALAQAAGDPKGAPAPLCTPDEHTLCLDQGRFAVTAAFHLTPSGPDTEAHAVPVTDQTGDFWFFDPANIELIVKVLNGCSPPFNTFWVFAAGLTNVGVVITVVDLRSQTTQRYTNEVGTPFLPIQDTNAFATCP
jgi:hypothetical protein